MNMNQFTQKTVSALERAQSLAIEYQHMQVDQEHLAAALLEDQAGLIPQLLGKMNVQVDLLRKDIADALGRMPRVTGSGREADKVYISADMEKALLEADDFEAYYNEPEEEEPELLWQQTDEDYEIYNTDDTDVDLEAYSEEVHQGTSGNGLSVVLTMLVMVALSASILLLMKYLGVL